MIPDSLLLFSKTEELFHKVYPTLNNYPRAEKFSVVQEIKMGFIRLLKFITLAANIKSKRKEYLFQADSELQQLKMLYRLSVKRKFIRLGFFEEVSEKLTEINKLLMGFIKSGENKDYQSSFSK